MADLLALNTPSDRRRRLLRIGAIVLASACVPAAAQDQPSILEYSGMCDASAAIALDKDIFLVASDEDNVLRVYRRGEFGIEAALLTGCRRRDRQQGGASQ